MAEELTPEIGYSSPTEAVRHLETRGYVGEAPFLQDIKDESARDNKLQHWQSERMTRVDERMGATPKSEEIVVLSEHEALTQLDAFLQDANRDLMQSGNEDLATKAEYLRTHLNYIGQKEFEQASAGIAELWKRYLKENPKEKLYVPLGITRTQDYTRRKSGEYLFDRIMSCFNDTEDLKLKQRIITDINKLRGTRSGRIVLLDDWSISGTQLGNGFASVHEIIGEAQTRSRLEVNLVAATASQLEKSTIQGRKIPFRAYYRACTSGDNEDRPVITGSHSSVDFEFEKPIEEMVAFLNKAYQDRPVNMPPCTNILKSHYENVLLQ